MVNSWLIDSFAGKTLGNHASNSARVFVHCRLNLPEAHHYGHVSCCNCDILKPVGHHQFNYLLWWLSLRLEICRVWYNIVYVIVIIILGSCSSWLTNFVSYSRIEMLHDVVLIIMVGHMDNGNSFFTLYDGAGSKLCLWGCKLVAELISLLERC